MSKHQFYLSKCEDAASKSTMCFTLGAVLVKGGKIISSGYNHYRTHYDGDDSKARGGKPLSMHAEMHAIYNAVGAAPSFKTQFVKAGNAALVSGAGGASATLFEKDEEEEYERGPISTSTPTVLSKQSKGSQPKQGTPAQPSKPMPVSQPASSTSHSRSTSGACATASSSLGNAPPASCFSTGKHKRKPRSPSSSPPRAESSCYGSVPANSRDLEQQWRAARAASTSSKLSWVCDISLQGSNCTAAREVGSSCKGCEPWRWEAEARFASANGIYV